METDPLPTAGKKPPDLRWFHPTPGRLLIGLLAVEGILLLSERFYWFTFNEKKGWTVLIAIAVVSITVVLMLLWFVLALCFHLQFQFSLRSLMVLTIAVAIPFSWLAVEMKRAREQTMLVKAVEKLGGVVVHDYRYTSKPKPTLPAPSWLLNLLGEDFFSEVVQEYQEYASRQIDRGQEHLRAFPHLKRLEMLNSTVGDAELEPVSGLAELEILNVGHTRITDNGLEHLQGLRQLQELWLNDTQVTDRGLVYLQKLHHLHYLNLTNTQVTDKGVGELQQALPKCCITR